MFNINEELDNIIFKYELDSNYPYYRNEKSFIKILKEWVGELGQKESKLVFIIGDLYEKRLFSWLIRENVEATYIEKSEYPDNIEWKEYTHICITAFGGAEEFKVYFEQNNITYTCIYDILSYNGYEFSEAFYKHSCFNEKEKMHINGAFGADEWRNNLQLDLYHEDEKLVQVNTIDEKLEVLGNCFFLSLWMKNFLCAQRYIEKIDDVDSKHKCLKAWQEILSLLEKIKQKLSERKHRDIITYWLDAIAYGDEKDMTYLSERIGQSIKFDNAFTVAPYTRSTSTSIFYELKQIDDYGYRVPKIIMDKSKLLNLIEDKGYIYKVISGCMNWFEGRYYYTDNYLEAFDSCSMVYWEVISNLLSIDEPLFLLAHSVEAHAPYFNTKMCGVKMYDENFEVHRNLGMQEIDEQLSFYDKLISDNACRIYMSDHGNHKISNNKFHVLFNVWDKSKKAKSIEEMFSLLDFRLIIEKIMEFKEIDEKCCRDYVEVQDVPYYGDRNIGYMLMNKKGYKSLYAFGYKGIVTKEYMYIAFFTDKEWLVSRNVAISELVDIYDNYVCDESILPYFRSKVREYPRDLLKKGRFLCMVFFYQFYKNKQKFMDAGLNKVKYILEQELCNVPQNSVGIRLGGYHSRMLYFIFWDILKDKVKCFIDIDEKCICSFFNVPVIALEQALNEGVQAIVLSSFDNIGRLRIEAEKYKKQIAVIDIYRKLDENGETCYTDFFWQFAPADFWDIGFSF